MNSSLQFRLAWRLALVFVGGNPGDLLRRPAASGQRQCRYPARRTDGGHRPGQGRALLRCRREAAAGSAGRSRICLCRRCARRPGGLRLRQTAARRSGTLVHRVPATGRPDRRLSGGRESHRPSEDPRRHRHPRRPGLAGGAGPGARRGIAAGDATHTAGGARHRRADLARRASAPAAPGARGGGDCAGGERAAPAAGRHAARADAAGSRDQRRPRSPRPWLPGPAGLHGRCRPSAPHAAGHSRRPSRHAWAIAPSRRRCARMWPA